jgi:YHS domain-containing protein
MINEQYMEKDQIAVEIEDRTYYGCCAMCVERLNKDEKSRYAIDPHSGKKVDKALAVIAADEDFNVFYFENEKNLDAYNSKAE